MFSEKEKYTIDDLVEIVKILRSENGCDWDKVQTHESIRMDLIEEAYEAAEAIDAANTEHLKEELGDLLLQVVFHARIEDEKESFDFDDVCDGISKKLVFRHPHVFGELKLDGAEQVLENWDKIKRNAKSQSFSDSLEDIPKVLPSLMRAQKIGKRAARSGLDFADTKACLEGLKSEITELENALESGGEAQIREVLGDILFSCANLARFLKINSEKALTDASNKFIIRFRGVENLALANGTPMDTLSPDELEELWQKQKRNSQSQD